MAVRINVDTQDLRFSLHCYEDAAWEGDHWLITEAGGPHIPDDEITSFQLEGDVGVHVEFYDRDDFDRGQSWGEVTLTRPGQRVNVSHLNRSTGGYVFHRVGGGKLAGKVDSILAERRRVRRA